MCHMEKGLYVSALEGQCFLVSSWVKGDDRDCYLLQFPYYKLSLTSKFYFQYQAHLDHCVSHPVK